MSDIAEFVVKYWLEAIFGLITLGVTTVWKVSSSKKKKEKEQEKLKEAQREQELQLLKDGVVALLHDRIYAIGEECLLAKEITVDKMDNLQHLFDAYEPLGGNGTGTNMVNRCKGLPVCKEVE